VAGGGFLAAVLDRSQSKRDNQSVSLDEICKKVGLRKSLRFIALLVLLAALTFWAAKGADRGWTKTNIARELPDPVTGLTGTTYEKGFVPGLDFLAGAALAAGVMAGASLLFRVKNPET
jgi:hypothetical protein